MFLLDLWLPILLCGIALFIASFVSWVILPHHFGDYKKLDDEDGMMEKVRSMNLPAGNYMFPQAESKQAMSSPEYAEKYKQGPRGTLNVYDMPNMGVNLGKTLLFFLLTSAVIGYVTQQACPNGSEFMKVFRVAGTIGILVHASSGMLNGIWFRTRLIMQFVDGIVYGLILGLIFAALWPAA